MKNCKSVQLPIVEPVYGTYHFQGGASAVIHDNPSIRNWFLNEVMNLCCSRMVLFGLTTPQIGIDKSTWEDVPFYDKRWYSTQFLRGCTNSVIRELLDSLYYVYFSGFDDYYMKGKTWYKERHFCHDGLYADMIRLIRPLLFLRMTTDGFTAALKFLRNVLMPEENQCIIKAFTVPYAE